MARRRRSRWPRGSRYSTRRSRRRSGPGWGAVITVAVLIAAGLWFIPRIQKSYERATNEQAPEGAQTLADSTDAATQRGDWDAALTFAVDLGKAAPNLSGAQLKLAIAWHNYATGMRTVHGEPRSVARTSVNRIECEIRALAAADSARSLAANEDEWIAAAEIYGKTLEYLGLPADAISIYSQILQRKPDDQPAQARADWLREHLKNPLLPDQL